YHFEQLPAPNDQIIILNRRRSYDIMRVLHSAREPETTVYVRWVARNKGHLANRGVQTLALPRKRGEPSRGTGGEARSGGRQNGDGTGRMVYEPGSTILGSRSQGVFLFLTQAGS